MASKGMPLFVLAVLAAFVTSAVANPPPPPPAFKVVYKDLDVTQTNVLSQYAQAINLKGVQVVAQGAAQKNAVSPPGPPKSTVTLDNVTITQANMLQQVAYAMNFGGSQFITQVASQTNNAGRRLLTPPPPTTWTVSFSNVEIYQKNFLEQTVKALNLWGHQTVAQAAVQSNTAGPKGPPPPAKYTVDVKDVDITQINVLTQLAVAINIGGNQTIIQNATQSNTVGK